jgi:hypothetical protein
MSEIRKLIGEARLISRVPKLNPYVEKGYGESYSIYYAMPQKGVSQNKKLLWTGTGFKLAMLASKWKEFGSEAEAKKYIKSKILPHIRKWMDSDHIKGY